jgi:hypothetical protein
MQYAVIIPIAFIQVTNVIQGEYKLSEYLYQLQFVRVQQQLFPYSKAPEQNHDTHAESVFTAQKSESPTTFQAKGITEALTSRDASHSKRTETRTSSNSSKHFVKVKIRNI